MKYLAIFVFVIVSNLVAIQAQHCILYEFHEKAVHTPRKSEIISASCERKGGRVTKYSSVIMNTVGPPVFNVTFHCCLKKECFSDLDCSFNFHCKSGQCKVANCDLSDSLDTVSREDDECIINEDCFFTIPEDHQNWVCVKDAACGVYRNCTKGSRFCKRCPTLYYRDVPKNYFRVKQKKQQQIHQQ
ncbi:hypothetical protein B4U80_04188 [Leptotrombidium deliense]|uniref:Uncharacterized protein n=1 Tax=Leptotrombidium deliense TaxID=299467 RepID=A0A443S9A8_9ACAR|nr:hypothetical protein B4U80_04188 [Leptotrombidium deliense]